MENEKNDKTSLAYWFPKISNLGIPVPKTLLVPFTYKDAGPFFNGLVDRLDETKMSEIRNAAKQIGYPVFMRTDLCSAKHDWKNSCYVQTEDDIPSHMQALLEYNEMADIRGLPYKYIVLREFLNLVTGFIAFPGDMPINKERRYFILNGQVICHHPYWPMAAFEDETSLHVHNQTDWKKKLADLNQEKSYEILVLEMYAKTVSEVLPGYWSVDFAQAQNGKWYLIDMAVGEASYHWPMCKNNLTI